jgi:vancomycin aglycone glucosyltransferase
MVTPRAPNQFTARRNTPMAVVAAGAPQLVVPQGADQVYWAGRVVGMGVGAAYDGRSANYEALSAALEATLTPETRKRANTLAGKIRTDGAMVAATLLLDAIG